MEPFPSSTQSVSRLPAPSAEANTCSKDRCSAIGFARLVWCIGAAARAAGLLVPGFIDVPDGTNRHLRRRHGHSPVVVLAVRGRPVSDVRDDLIAGVLAANRGSPSQFITAFLQATNSDLQHVNTAA